MPNYNLTRDDYILFSYPLFLCFLCSQMCLEAPLSLLYRDLGALEVVSIHSTYIIRIGQSLYFIFKQ